MLSREEQEEYAGFVTTRLQEYTLRRKLIRTLRGLFTSSERMDGLRGNLIARTGPRFADYVKRSSAYDEFMTDLQIRYFEKRIRTLPRETLIRLSDELDEIGKVKSEKVRERLLANFYHSLNLTYSLNGWFLHRYAEELKKKPW
jgi:hypothetical protein